MTPDGRDERRFLDPTVIASLASMELRARSIVDGFLLGLHRSPDSGFSVEFSEYRPYMPGDDLSTLDWKVYGRRDRFYVKTFDAETSIEGRIVLDVSASMSYRSHGVSKLDYGSYLAAALAYLMRRQHDAAGLVTVDDRVVTDVPVSARPGHLRRILVALDRLEVGRRSDLSKPLTRLAATLRRRGIVVLISDLLDAPAAVVSGLRHLRFRGSDVIVFHLVDPAEASFPFDRPTRFHDLETGDEVTTGGAEARAGYLRAMRDQRVRYERELRQAGIDYHRVETSTALDIALRAYLATRGRLW